MNDWQPFVSGSWAAQGQLKEHINALSSIAALVDTSVVISLSFLWIKRSDCGDGMYIFCNCSYKQMSFWNLCHWKEFLSRVSVIFFTALSLCSLHHNILKLSYNKIAYQSLSPPLCSSYLLPASYCLIWPGIQKKRKSGTPVSCPHTCKISNTIKVRPLGCPSTF